MFRYGPEADIIFLLAEERIGPREDKQEMVASVKKADGYLRGRGAR